MTSGGPNTGIETYKGARTQRPAGGECTKYPVREKIRELAIELVLTDAEIVLTDLRDLQVQLALELQAVRDQRQREHVEFRELIGEIKNELIRIQARFHIDAHLIGLIKAPQAKTGESRHETGEFATRFDM
jgi:hypothetical protein